MTECKPTDSDFNDHRLIFIGGSPRSGTTLVQNILDCHPLILGGPEFLHLPDMIALRRKLHGSIRREWINIFCSRDDVDQQLVKWIKMMFLSLADKHQCRYYSEKTPENILVFPELMALFPQSYFIHVIRDPRAILSSMRDVKKRAIAKGLRPPFFTADSGKSIAYIKRCFEPGFKACRQASGKVLTVIYEKLIADPEAHLKIICEFLNIDWDEHMLHPGEKNHLGVEAITTKSNEIWYESNTFNRNIVAKESEKWKQKLPILHQVRATMVFAEQKELVDIGYDLSIRGLVHEHGILHRLIIYSLFWGMTVFRAARNFVTGIPGLHLFKNILKPSHRI